MQPQKPPRSLDGLGRRPRSQPVSRPRTVSTPQYRRPGPRRIPRSQAVNIPREPQVETITDRDITSTDLEVSQPVQKGWRRFFTKRRILIGSGLLFAGLLVVVGVAAWFLKNSIIVENTGYAAPSLQGQVDPSQLRGEGDGRVNILLIGIGGEGHTAGSLSDSIMLVSLDPIAKTVAMLSIPRDLYVEIPGYGSAKINAAHAYGQQYDYEGGGPALLKKTVEQVLDVPIHYYVRADFEGFKQMIDIVGGVEVNVEETIDDYRYPDDRLAGYDHFYLEAGRQHLDGETALKYARSRYSTSDFDRSRRQQQVLLALKDKAVSLGTLSNPVKVARLLESLGAHVQTDLQVDEIMRLLELGRNINADDVVRAQLDTSEDNYLTTTNIYGQSALVPSSGDFSEIQVYVRGILVDSYIKDEAAKVSILNGTTTAGLATRTGELLRSYGYQVVNIDNASAQNYTQTVIFDYTGDNPYTIHYLEERFGVSAQRRDAPASAQGLDIEIVLGSGYDPDTE